MIYSNLHFSENKEDITFPLFNDFIKAVSDDFYPAFLSYVDLSAYFEKINSLSELLTCWHENKIVGLVSIYSNNKDTRKGYIGFVAVHPDYRKNHIANQLVQQSLDLARNKGMRTVTIRTNNVIAYNFYKKLGFLDDDKIYEDDIKLTRYYLHFDL